MPRRLIRSVGRTVGRTAVIAGTATAVSGHVARRQHEKAQRIAAPPPPDGSVDVVARLQVLTDLRTAGSLSDKEFAAAKARVLGG